MDGSPRPRYLERQGEIMIRSLTVILCACAVLLQSAGVFAQSDQDDALRAVRSGQIMSYGEIRKRAEAALGGTVIGQDAPRKSGKRWVYSLRVLQRTGQVVQVDVDARNGKILRRKGGR
jgi:uncharacterized membrane protein YkoI